MATGTGIPQQRGPVTSDITPQVALPTVGDDWDRIAATFDRLNANVFRPVLERRAAQLGAQEGAEVADGTREYRPLFAFGDVAEAREAALNAAYQARIRTDIDTREAEIRREHALDPEGYQASAERAVSGFLEGAPDAFAVDVQTYARDRFATGQQVVSDARSLRDRQETAQALAVREATLAERLIALASQDGGLESPEYAAALAERDGVQQMRADNPDILYSPEQRTYDDSEMETGVLSARVTGLAVQAYGEAGRGLAGLAAGVRFLDEEVLNGEAFSDLTPEQRQRVFRDSRAQLNDYAAADREQARAQAEEEARRRAAETERVGEILLDIEDGEYSVGDVAGMEDISDTNRLRLRRAIERRDRQAVADARRDQAIASTAAYGELSDQAAAGGLTPEEIATARAAGLITASQARTLRSLNDRTLAPVIRDVLAPFEDSLRRPGMGTRPTAELRARAQEEAARWAGANPETTLDERIAAGRIIAESVLGQRASGGGQSGGQSGASGRAARLQALQQQRASGAINQTEFERRRREILNGD